MVVFVFYPFIIQAIHAWIMARDEFKVPFDEHGNLITDPYVINWEWEIPDPSKVTWKENIPFSDTMRIGLAINYNSYHASKSSSFHETTSTSTGKSFPIYNSDLARVIEHNILDHGVVSGTWKFTRHSGKIGIHMVFNDANA